MKKNISLILCIAILLSLVPMELNASTGILKIIYGEGDYQALTYSVRYTPSDAPLQAFTEGWNISIGSISVLVKVSPSFSGGDRTYVIPLTKGYSGGDATPFLNGSCIEDLIPENKKDEFYSIITRATGGTITVNARIQKYKYSNGNYTATGVIANTSTELLNKFSEFSDDFLNTTVQDYYNLVLPITAEPIVVPGIPPIAALGFSDTDDMVKHIYLGDDISIIDKSYTREPGKEIIRWLVEIKANVNGTSKVILPKQWITNPYEFFKTYNFPETGTYEFILHQVEQN